MLTMIEARKKAYDIFPPELVPPERTEQVNILKYIEHLGAATKTTIDHWPLDIFKNPETEKLYLKRVKVNELFFQYREKVPAAATPTDVISEAVTLKMIHLAKNVMAQALRMATRKRDNKRSVVRDVANQLSFEQRQLNEAEIALLGFQNGEVTSVRMFDGIKHILDDGFWRLHSVQGKFTLRLQSQEITLSHLNKPAAITTVVPMGTYFLELWLEDAIIKARVFPGGNNPIFGNYFHPHLRGSEVCLGGYLPTYSTAAATFDFFTVADIVKAVLTSYNNDSPYVSLHKFEESYQLGKFIPRTEFTEDSNSFEDGENDDENNDEDQAEEDENGNPL